jgi:hypothetical protein
VSIEALKLLIPTRLPFYLHSLLAFPISVETSLQEQKQLNNAFPEFNHAITCNLDGSMMRRRAAIQSRNTSSSPPQGRTATHFPLPRLHIPSDYDGFSASARWRIQDYLSPQTDFGPRRVRLPPHHGLNCTNDLTNPQPRFHRSPPYRFALPLVPPLHKLRLNRS